VVVPLTILNMNSICQPLEQARLLAQAIAGGDLSQRVVVNGKDEVADLQRTQQAMQDGLSALVSQVRNASESVATASQEIASGNQDLSVRTEKSASSVQDTVGSLAELTENVQQTAHAAQTARQLSDSAYKLAARGGQVVTQAVGSMHEIAASSSKINDIVGLIDSIAFQTNILALNAAVEAARAGEQGRGFAVVASEVRMLAKRSAAAAQEIKGLVSTSVHAVDGGVKLVEEAGAAMKEMVDGVQRVGEIIGEISSSSTEQSSGIAQVNQSVGLIDQATQQNAALVEQSAAAAQGLREQADALAQVVRQFRLQGSAA
jgi:methyl-accepting chemotaxis protein